MGLFIIHHWIKTAVDEIVVHIQSGFFNLTTGLPSNQWKTESAMGELLPSPLYAGSGTLCISSSYFCSARGSRAGGADSFTAATLSGLWWTSWHFQKNSGPTSSISKWVYEAEAKDSFTNAKHSHGRGSAVTPVKTIPSIFQAAIFKLDPIY